MINHPLYNQVCEIIDSKVKNRSIRHSEFSHIRNQASVRAILAFKGYHPNCTTLTYLWSLDAFKMKDIKDVNQQMKTKTGQKILDDLKDNGVYHVANFDKSRQQLSNILVDIRALGYQLEPTRTGRTITSYKLITGEVA